MTEKTYECSADCGLKYVATEARAQKWLCRCGIGKIVASWWGKNPEEKEVPDRPNPHLLPEEKFQ